MRTPLTDKLRIGLPVIQAPVGSATVPVLAAAVSNAGGLGTLALSWKTADETRTMIRQTRKLTEKPFAVNLVLAYDQDERVRICIEEQVPVVSFFWGNPTRYFQELKKNNILVCQTVGSSEEAVEYEKAGADLLIAQGWEAGGHIWGSVATSVLIPSIKDKVKIPVAAAGGIADGRGMLAAISLGADGVCLGTRFLMSDEAYIHHQYQLHISVASEDDTVYTGRLFNIGWDHAPHRVIRNSTVASWEKAGKQAPGNRPNENEIIARKENGTPVLRYSDDTALKYTSGNLEALAMYAGQSAGLIRDVKPAAIIVKQLMEEFYREYGRLQALVGSLPLY